jgi:hypothetical protein
VRLERLQVEVEDAAGDRGLERAVDRDELLALFRILEPEID